jgi:hypothetical protein
MSTFVRHRRRVLIDLLPLEYSVHVCVRACVRVDKVLRRHVDISIARPCSDLLSCSIFIGIKARGRCRNGARLTALGPIPVVLQRVLHMHSRFKVKSLTTLGKRSTGHEWTFLCLLWFNFVLFNAWRCGYLLLLLLSLWKKLANSLQRSRRSLETESREAAFIYLYAYLYIYLKYVATKNSKLMKIHSYCVFMHLFVN